MLHDLAGQRRYEEGWRVRGEAWWRGGGGGRRRWRVRKGVGQWRERDRELRGEGSSVVGKGWRVKGVEKWVVLFRSLE